MGLLTPWFLGGLAALGLPVWLHLLRKHKATPLPFSSLMFFERRTQSSIKHRRLRYLILFSLRMLLALLALAFAHPYLEQKLPPQSSAGEVAVVAIDNSLSMRRRLGWPRPNLAKSVVRGMRPGQRGQVLAFGARVEALSEVTDDKRSMQPSTPSRLPTAHFFCRAGARAALDRAIASAPLRAHVYSDMQQTGMPANFNDLRLGDNPSGAASAGFGADAQFRGGERGGAASRLRRQQEPRAGHGGRIWHCQGTAHGSLALNGRAIESKAVSARQAAAPRPNSFRSKCLTGTTRATCGSTAPMRWPADDVFYFSVERADARHALFVHAPDNTRGLLYFKTALEATGQSASPSTLPPPTRPPMSRPINTPS